MFASYLFETVFRRRVAPDFDATGNLISIELIAQVCLRKKILKIIQVVFILILILDTQDLCKLIFRYVMLIKLRRKKREKLSAAKSINTKLIIYIDSSSS